MWLLRRPLSRRSDSFQSTIVSPSNEFAH